MALRKREILLYLPILADKVMVLNLICPHLANPLLWSMAETLKEISSELLDGQYWWLVYFQSLTCHTGPGAKACSILPRPGWHSKTWQQDMWHVALLLLLQQGSPPCWAHTDTQFTAKWASLGTGVGLICYSANRAKKMCLEDRPSWICISIVYQP